MAILGIAMIACSGGDDAPGGNESPVQDPPALVSTSPAQGATGISDGELTVTLTYDQTINLSVGGYQWVTIDNEAQVTNVYAMQKNLTVQLSGLKKETTYTLTVGKGAVTGLGKAEAAPVSLTFTTVDKPAPPTAQGKLCTPNPMAETQLLYNYLLTVYGEKILSSTMANVNWNTNEAELVYKATGKYPAINTFDYIHLSSSPANWIDYSNTQVAEEWNKAGGIVSAGWHWMVPSKQGEKDSYTYEPEKTLFRAANIFKEDSWEKKIADADLEEMAGYLKLLQDKGIPVIWRPLHEAAGNTYEYNGGKAWFWWGYDGAEVYVKLWRYMFDFFQAKGINNLIWVWTSQQKDEPYYPGDAYVDIISRDIYNQKDEKKNADEFKTIQQVYPHKIVTLSECGSVSKISDQWKAGAKWSWFMPWYHYDATSLDGHQHADTDWWKDAMNCSFVLDREAVKKALK